MVDHIHLDKNIFIILFFLKNIMKVFTIYFLFIVYIFK
jgi:hypothetical protein